MDHSLSGFIANFVPLALAIPLAIIGGIMMIDRHSRNALVLLRIAIILLGIEPLIWARATTDTDWRWWAGCLGSGAVLGLLFYGCGLWFRNEQAHNQAHDNAPTKIDK